MYPLFAETHTDAGTLRLKRIDRPADSRNEVRIPAGHTRDGLPVRATLDDRVLWSALFARDDHDQSAIGIWMFPDGLTALILSMGALYCLDATNPETAKVVAHGVSRLAVAETLRLAVYSHIHDQYLRIYHLDGRIEIHSFAIDPPFIAIGICNGIVWGLADGYDGVVWVSIDLSASEAASSYVKQQTLEDHGGY